jgi:hypothetical protein
MEGYRPSCRTKPALLRARSSLVEAAQNGRRSANPSQLFCAVASFIDGRLIDLPAYAT